MSDFSPRASSALRAVMHYFEGCGAEGEVANASLLRALSRAVELGADTLPACFEAICDGYVTAVKDRSAV